MGITYYTNTLLESGTFLTLGSGITRLKIDYKNDVAYLDFNVVVDEEIEEHNNLLFSVVAPDTVELKITNYTQIMGNPSIGPHAVGQIGGDSLHIILRVSGTKQDNIKEITYSLYIEESE